MIVRIFPITILLFPVQKLVLLYCGSLHRRLPRQLKKLSVTAQEHYMLRIADDIIPEPLGGAHADPVWSSQRIKDATLQEMEELTRMNTEELLRHRMLKFRAIGLGGFREGVEVEPEQKHNMKPSEVMFSGIESELEDLNSQEGDRECYT
ncbi:acetyl-coenzyme A carboxylase carboxyl transferase subunit alpha, chloroplastic-like [Primulina eburnea]|uniref:acetyl-coenzyme A carboxylase carboxyl transferase subunit alpha, chloroplastic-like n=1 Tax=Primulina eburnea TaxID=1245227 RepID=UPI003C6BDA0D